MLAPVETDPASRHEEARDFVNAWRGHCIHHFTRAEAALSDALEIAGISDPGTLGNRLSVAVKNIALLQRGEEAQSKLQTALDELRPLLLTRNTLVHGHGGIWLDRHGSWVWTYQMPPQGKGKAATRGYFTASDAEKLRKSIGATVDRLRAALR